MNKTYYTKTEDGSFHPITLNQTLASDILGEILSAEIRSALTSKVEALVESIDLTSQVDGAIRALDIDDIASEVVRDEIERRAENIDIDVNVSI